MSENTGVEVKEGQKEFFLDFHGAIKTLRNRGVETNFEKVANELGYTRQGLSKMVDKPPKALVIVLTFLKDNDLRFEDLVKEREPKK